MIWLWVESKHQPRAYETLALIPLELHSRFQILEARGGVEPRAFPPSSSEVRFRRPTPGTRAMSLPIFDCRLPIGLVNQQCIDANIRE